MKLYLLGLALWFVLLVLAVLNGTLRDFVWGASLSEPIRHFIGTAIALVLHFTAIFLFVRHFAAGATGGQLLLLGLMLAMLTVAFEFGFFGGVRGVPYAKLAADYNIFKGRLFGLVLLNALLAPYISAKLLGRI